MHAPSLPRRNPNFPTLVTWTDPAGKLHVPPDPPLVEGCPPWMQRPNEYRRKVHLRKCPSHRCRRAKKCIDPHYGKFCQITHMLADDYRAQLLERITVLLESRGIPRSPPPKPGEPNDPPPASLKRCLEQASIEKQREALLNFQNNWIEEQKRKFATRTNPRSRKASDQITLSA